MWICLTDSFISVVENLNDPTTLLVRARLPDDIQRLFPKAEVWEDIKADYRYRAVLPRRSVADIIANRINEIQYDNFKEAVDTDERHHAYLGCWSALRRMQPT